MSSKKVEKKEEKYEMEFRKLGNTGLLVSVLSFGYWATFGVMEGLDKCVKLMKIARKAGINFFDNAETYGKNPGDAEKIMGLALEKLKKEDSELWARDEIIVTTKIFWGGKSANKKGLSKKHLRDGLNKSLKRLKLEYVDIVFCHRYDVLTPTEEVVRAMTQIIRSGKALYWGTSEWTSQKITEAYWIAKINGLEPPVVEQPQYNMCHREKMEKDFLPVFQSPYGIGTTVWSPLKSGVLTGKYLDKIPKGSRLDHEMYGWLKKSWLSEKDKLSGTIRALMKYAKEIETTLPILAIAWVIKNKNVSTCLLGATKESQLTENLKAMTLARKLSKKNMSDIEKILGNAPVQVAHWGRFLTKLIK